MDLIEFWPLKRKNLIGGSIKDVLRVDFDKKLKLEFHGTKVTSDAGLLAYRELDEALGLTTVIKSNFCDNRKGKNTQHNIIALLRQSIYGRLAGYEDTNDAERLSVDPAMRQVIVVAQSRITVARKEQFHLNSNMFLFRLWGQAQVL